MNEQQPAARTAAAPSPVERGVGIAVVFAVLLGCAALFALASDPLDFDITRPFSAAGLLFVAAMLLPLLAAQYFMKRWDVRWSDYGLNLQLPVWRILVYAMVTLVALHIAGMVIIPWAVEFADQQPDVTYLMALPGDLAGFILALLLMWITVALMAEMLCRGFLMNETAGALGAGKLAWAVSVLVVGVAFGLLHAYQGLSGILMTGGIGIVLGVLYLLMGRNLWPLIIAYGLFNSIHFYQVYALG